MLSVKVEKEKEVETKELDPILLELDSGKSDGEESQSVRKKRKRKWYRVEDSRSAKIEDIELSDTKTEDESEKVEDQVSKDLHLSQIEEQMDIQSENVFVRYLNFMCCVILF